MLKRILNRLKEKCGAATIEAVVAFTGFLFVIITILNVANYCRAQMIISNAVDAAARELSQYSYFYNMTGMQKFNNYVNENAGIGAANINDVIDGTNSVYTTLSGALSDTTDYGNQLADKIDNQNLTYQDIQTAVLKLDTNSTNIMSSITTMEAKFSSVERNPLLYMKSLAAVAGGEALDLAKSYVIAAPLAKLFTSVNINSGDTSVQQYLENLGIVGGFDGLNFNTSTIFTASAPDEIHLRCYYKISLCNFVDKSLFEIPICKEAVCRAWLGGDDNPVKVSAQAAVPAPEDDGSRSTPEQADADVSGGEVADGDVSGGEGGLPIVGADDEEKGDDYLALISTLRDENSSQEEKEKVFKEYINTVNAEGGADYKTSLDIYRLSLQFDVDIDKLGLVSTDGKEISAEALDIALAESVTDYPSYMEMVKFYGSVSSMSIEEKLDKIGGHYEDYAYKKDILIPLDASYLLDINERDGFVYDWGEHEGFRDGYAAMSRDGKGLPAYWDRYGAGNGRNFSDIPNDRPAYTADERAIPYVTNTDCYHSGSTTSDFYFDFCDAVRSGDLGEINKVLVENSIGEIEQDEFNALIKEYDSYLTKLNDEFRYVNDEGKVETFDAPYGISGEAAAFKDLEGGATQYFTPFTVKTLETYGILHE